MPDDKKKRRLRLLKPGERRKVDPTDSSNTFIDATDVKFQSPAEMKMMKKESKGKVDFTDKKQKQERILKVLGREKDKK